MEDSRENHSGLSIALREPPGTPLVRGARNYFPDGFKINRTPRSASSRSTFYPSLEEDSPRSSAPLHLRWPPNTAHPRLRCRTNQFGGVAQQTDNTASRIERNAIVSATTGETNFHQKPLDQILPRYTLKRDVVIYAQEAEVIREVAQSKRAPKEIGISRKPEEIAENECDWLSSVSSSFISLRSDASARSDENPSRADVTSPTTTTSSPRSPRGITPVEATIDVSDNKPADHDEDRQGFQVHVRIKPLEEQDFGASSSNRLRSITVRGNRSITLCTRPSAKKENNGNKYTFAFDRVLDELSTQKDAYDITVHPLVEMMLKGHHTCVVTYGSPGTGKSYSLFGKASSGKHKGIITRATETLLSEMEKESDCKTKLSISFLQLYNEKFYDLLDSSATDNIRFHDFGDSSQLEGFSELPIETVDDVTKQLRRNPNRLRDSGRSHTVFTLYYRKEEELDQENESEKKSIRTTEGKINFVDLVGVSRSTKHSTHDSVGNNANAKANKSLQVFSKVILLLTQPSQDHSASYRDSKLTRFLKEPLGGNCATRLLVTASSCPNSVHETLVCLQFASSAASVKNFPSPCVSVAIPIEDEPQKTKDDAGNENEQFSEDTEKSQISSEDLKHEENVRNNLISLPPIPGKTLSISDGGSAELLRTKSGEGNSVTTAPTSTLTCDSTSPVARENERPRQESFAKSPRQGNNTRNDGSSDKAKRLKRRRKSRSFDILNGHSPENSQQNCGPDRSGPSRHASSTISSIDSNGMVVALPSIDGASRTSRTTQPRGDVNPVNEDMRFRKRGESTGKQNSDFADYLVDSKNSGKESILERRNDGLKSQNSSLALAAGNHDKCHSDNKEKDATRVKRNDNSAVTEDGYGSGRGSVGSSELERSCCSRCREREDQIKRNYDRLIMFSKKDKESKQQRIEELEQLLANEKEQSGCWSELERLREEHTTDRLALQKTAQAQVVKFEEIIKDYKAKLSKTVSAKELSNVQEIRRKESALLEEQRQQIATLTKNLEEQTKGASKMLEKKSEQIQNLDKEKKKLLQEKNELEQELKSAHSKFHSSFNKGKTEQDKVIAKYEDVAKEMSVKLSNALTQVSLLKEEKTKSNKAHKEKQEAMQHELNAITKKLNASQQDFDKLKNKSKSESRKTSNSSTVVEVSTNTEDNMKEKLNGLAYSVQCLRCAANGALANGEFDDSSDVRDAELRILLFQDSKNREVLIQLKRERNLLRDVMKIMYCRQWFTEDGKPHVKRTLKRVGIDTRELEILKKTTQA